MQIHSLICYLLANLEIFFCQEPSFLAISPLWCHWKKLEKDVKKIKNKRVQSTNSGLSWEGHTEQFPSHKTHLFRRSTFLAFTPIFQDHQRRDSLFDTMLCFDFHRLPASLYDATYLSWFLLFFNLKDILPVTCLSLWIGEKPILCIKVEAQNRASRFECTKQRSSSSHGGPHMRCFQLNRQRPQAEFPKLVLLMQPGSSGQFFFLPLIGGGGAWKRGRHACIRKHRTPRRVTGMKGERRLVSRHSLFRTNHPKSLFVLDHPSPPFHSLSPPTLDAHHPAAVIKHSFISLHPVVQFGHIIPCLSRGNLHKHSKRTHLFYRVWYTLWSKKEGRNM